MYLWLLRPAYFYSGQSYAKRSILSFVFFLVLITVAPKIDNFTTGPSAVHMGQDIIATCCVSGYPQPLITINGNDRPTSFNQTNGVFRGCASYTIATSGIAPGTVITTRCQVTLTQNRSCANGSSDAKHRVLEREMDSCLVALADTSQNVTNIIVGK